MQPYITAAGTGYLQDPSSTSECAFCQIEYTNDFLRTFNYSFDNRWRGAFSFHYSSTHFGTHRIDAVYLANQILASCGCTSSSTPSPPACSTTLRAWYVFHASPTLPAGHSATMPLADHGADALRRGPPWHADPCFRTHSPRRAASRKSRRRSPSRSSPSRSARRSRAARRARTTPLSVWATPFLRSTTRSRTTTPVRPQRQRRRSRRRRAPMASPRSMGLHRLCRLRRKLARLPLQIFLVSVPVPSLF